MKTTFKPIQKRFVGALTAATLTLAALMPMGAQAATTAITGGTNGAACDSGGYFTPSAVTVSSGDTVTISVPSNDPYPDGLEVHGFPGGMFVIARGSSHITSALTATISYYATWPGEENCMKGSGTVTVSVAAVPAPTPTPTPAPVSNSTPSLTSTSTPSDTTTPAATDTTTPVTPTVQPKKTTTLAATTTKKSGMHSSTVAAATGGIVVVLAVVGYIVWRFLLHR